MTSHDSKTAFNKTADKPATSETAAIGGVLDQKALLNLARAAEEGIAATGFSADARRKRNSENDERARKVADLADTALSYQQFQQVAVDFIDEKIAGLDEEIRSLSEQIAERQARQTEIQQQTAAVSAALATAEQEAGAISTEIAANDALLATERDDMQATQDRLAFQKQIREQAQQTAHENATLLPGSTDKMVAQRVEGNADEGYTTTLVIVDMETSQTIGTVNDLPAAVRNQILHDVAGQGPLPSEQAATGTLSAQITALDEQRLAESQTTITSLESQQGFLQGKLGELRSEIKTLASELKTLEAEGKLNETEIARLQDELAQKSEQRQELAALRTEVQNGTISQEEFGTRMEDMGYGEEWRNQTSPENIAATEYSYQQSASLWDRIKSIKDMIVGGATPDQSAEINSLQTQSRELRALRSDIGNGTVSGADAENRLSTLYGDQWSAYKEDYGAQGTTSAPAATTAGYDRALGTASGGMAAGGGTTGAFKAAAVGAPDVAAPAPTLPAFEQQRVHIGMGGVGGMGG